VWNKIFKWKVHLIWMSCACIYFSHTHTHTHTHTLTHSQTYNLNSITVGTQSENCFVVRRIVIWNIFLEIMDIVLQDKIRGTVQLVISSQFKSLLLWGFGGALVPMKLATCSSEKVYQGFRDTYDPIHMTYTFQGIPSQFQQDLAET